MKLLILIAVLAAAASTGFAARVVCYYTNWSRFGSEPFNVEDINAKLCTHVVYSFFGLENNGNIKSLDPWNDFGDEWTQGAIKRFLKLKNANPNVKLLLGVGGWGEGSTKFRMMIGNSQYRKNFITSTMAFLSQYQFDGLDINWVYHGVYDVLGSDKVYLKELLTEMKPLYKAKGYLLGFATSGNHQIFDAAYDIPSLSKNVDFINIMSYDFHGSWDKKTGHVAPLHPLRGETGSELEMNVAASVNRHLKAGANAEMLNVGLVAYGRTFALQNPQNNGLGAPATGPGPIEPLPYRTFCIQDKDGQWKKNRNDEQKVPYAISGNIWTGYEDSQSLIEKVKFAKSKKLGGISFWSIDQDDFKGRCGSVPYPLLEAAKNELNRA